MGFRCMVPAVTQLVKHRAGFAVSWLLGFGVVDPENRPGPVPGSILSDLGSGAGSSLENIPEAEQGQGAFSSSWVQAGLCAGSPRSDAVLGLGSVVLHPHSQFFPGWWAAGDRCGGYITHCHALLRRAKESYSPAGRKRKQSRYHLVGKDSNWILPHL